MDLQSYPMLSDRVLGLDELKNNSALTRKSLIVITSPEQLDTVSRLTDLRLAGCREDVARQCAERGMECVQPADFGYAFIQISETLNTINYRLYKGRFNLYDYQWPLIESLEDFLATDERLAFFDGEPLYTGSDYNLSHFAGNLIMYPIDVLNGLLEFCAPDLILCVDPDGSSMEHYILHHLAAEVGLEYIRVGESPPCVA
ncbi:hypothetical protein [Pseudodesulfovibrio sediminis]|uniref:Uncharacterized protein n=1 Tax=Pseudodesulfovibrio sediminis TaxID=2810563 RepID=A0ABN6EWF9_9BACT|nr:hypothetical protein [Pseudodesulfovibrio sediminis]BCS89188.1 hypothetical protein PSDVSF_24300 [Pseudodesulfovibrio sediminis]